MMMPSFFKRPSRPKTQERTRQARQDAREEPRLVRCLRVSAPELPQERALTVDLSHSGVCLETFAPVQVGIEFMLEFELGIFPIYLKARVQWCETVAKGIYRVGLSIDESSPHSLHAYQRYVRKEMELESLA